MFLFPFAYLVSFFYAVTQMFKKQIEGFLIFVIVGLPIYINAMSVSFMYGFSRWIPLLQNLPIKYNKQKKDRFFKAINLAIIV